MRFSGRFGRAGPLKPVVRRAAAFLALLAFLAAMARTQVTSSAAFSSFIAPATSAPLGSLTVWQPAGHCHGRFTAGPAPDSPDALPYALLREAVIDRRPASLRQFRRQTRGARPFMRLILFVTAHLSVSMLTPSSPASADRPSVHVLARNVTGDETGFTAQIDNVLHVNPYVLKPGRYAPGKETRYGQEVTEWQVIVSLVPSARTSSESEASFAARLQALSQDIGSDAQLRLSLPLRRYDNAPVAPFDAALSLACVLGWEDHNSFPRLSRFRSGKICGAGSDGAVAIAGSALHGDKRVFEKHYHEIAHFAARALMGPMPFDAVRPGQRGGQHL
jgi:hypothetical protein